MPRKACRVVCLGEPCLIPSRQRAWRSISGCRILAEPLLQGADIIDLSALRSNGRTGASPPPPFFLLGEETTGITTPWRIVGLRDWAPPVSAGGIPELWRRFSRKTSGLRETLTERPLGEACSIRSRWLLTDRAARHFGVTGIEGLWDMAGQQLDVCMWLAGQELATASGSLREVGGVFSPRGRNGHLQALLELDGGVIVFLDLSNSLAPGAWPIDQLEWVGTEGMACDQPLDAPGAIEGYSFTRGNRRVDWTPEFPGATPEVVAARRIFCEAALEWTRQGEVPQEILETAGRAALALHRLRAAVQNEGADANEK